MDCDAKKDAHTTPPYTAFNPTHTTLTAGRMPTLLLLSFLFFWFHLIRSESKLAISFKKSIITQDVVKFQAIQETTNIPITYQQSLKLFIEDEDFRNAFVQVLTSIPMESFYWECPPLSTKNSKKPFEFVLIRAQLHLKTTNPKNFEEYLQNCANGVVSFQNLGGDATLIVPCPIIRDSISLDYGHFAAFIRSAPSDQINNLLVHIGQEGFRALKMSRPELVWLSTSGGGVPWLHIRFDSSPKYYNFKPYKDNAWFRNYER
jgi:hypothetical protein